MIPECENEKNIKFLIDKGNGKCIVEDIIF